MEQKIILFSLKKEEKSSTKMEYKLEVELMLKDFKIKSLEKKLDAVLSIIRFDEIVKKMRYVEYLFS